MDGCTADVARSNIEAPEARALIQSEHSSTAHGQMAAARRLAHNSNQSRLDIHREQVTRGYAGDGLSRRGRDCVNHRLARNTLAEVFDNRFLETPLLDPLLPEVQLRHGHAPAAAAPLPAAD